MLETETSYTHINRVVKMIEEELSNFEESKDGGTLEALLHMLEENRDTALTKSRYLKNACYQARKSIDKRLHKDVLSILETIILLSSLSVVIGSLTAIILSVV